MKHICKKVLGILVASSLLLGIIANYGITIVFAEDKTFPGSGSGTDVDPYEIGSIDQLKEIKNYPNSYFRLVHDIDLSTESNWEKISEFSGVLDGNNYTISNLKIDSSRSEYEGLFGKMSNATVKNLKITDAMVSSYREHIGILAGYADNCDITNCQISGAVWGWGDSGNTVGGIIGELKEGSIIESSFAGTMDGNFTVGGIVGENTHGNIFNCFASSRKEDDKISGNTPTGGIVGYNTGKVAGCYNTSRVHGNNWYGCDTGGIVGVNDGEIIGCYNTGRVDSVAGRSGSRTSGGIAGLNKKSIKDCYNTGEVAADITEVYGICKTSSKYATLQNCYNIGELKGYYECSGDYTKAYGITNDVDFLSTGETNLVENCYYLDNVPEAGKGNILSESAMKLSSSYLGFDFDNIWTSESTDGFPHLKIFLPFDNIEDETEPPEFTLGRDNNIFNHSADSFFLNTTEDYQINSAAYRSALYKNQSDNYCNLLLQKQFENWVGSCYGISTSILYAYKKGYDINKYIPEENMDYPYYASAGLPVYNTKFKDLIQVFQLSQYRSDATYTDTANNSFAYKTFGIGSSIKTVLKGIVDEAEKSNYINPFLLGFTYKDGGHALLVCGSEGEVNGYYKIAICDPNGSPIYNDKIDQFVYHYDEYSYLMISEDYASFHMENKDGLIIYPKKIDDDNFKEIKYVTYEDAYSRAQKNKEDYCEVIVNVNNPFYMTTDNGTYLSYDGEKFTGNAIVENVSTAINESNGKENANWIIELSGVNKVSFSNIDSTMEVDCLFDSDEYINVTGNDLTTISFEDNKGVSIEGANATYTLSMSAKDDNNTLIQSSGTVNDAAVSYLYDGSNIQIEGIDNKSDITLNKVTDNGIVELDKATDPSVTISQDEAPNEITSISLDKKTLTLNIGVKSTLITSVQPASIVGYTINWTSSDSNVATVSQTGEVKAVASGTATITASVNGHSATCTVTVNSGTSGGSTDTENTGSNTGGNTSGNTGTSSSGGSTAGSAVENTGTVDNNSTDSDTRKEDSIEQPVKYPQTNNVEIGDKITKANVTYTITDVNTKEVSYTKTTSKSSKITIPATVKIDGVTYKVTKIANNAFKNNKYVTKIVLGSNITEIGDNAFKGCLKLKSITITSKVKVIGSNAFSGDKKLTVLTIKSGKLTKKGVKNSLKGSSIQTIKLSGTAKNYYKKYVKYFSKSNSGKTVKIKK